MPRVSVLIPAYNAQSTLEAAIGSVLRQTLADLEVVVVDDGSTDRTPELLEAIAMRDTRVRVAHQPRGGIIAALNAGIELCESPLIARMDADDISHPRRLESQAGMMGAVPALSVCSCLVRMFPRQGLLGGMVRYEQWLNSLLRPEEIARDMFVESPVAHPSVMLRRNELIELGGYQERGWAEDYDLWLRYHIAGKRFVKVPEMLLCWRQSAGQLTFADSRYSLENFLRAKAHYLALMLVGRERPIVLWGAGKMGRRILKHLTREGIEVEAVVDIDPLKIGRTLRSRPIVAMGYLESRREAFVIVAVGSHGSRAIIRGTLGEMGFAEPHDFVCAA